MEGRDLMEFFEAFVALGLRRARGNAIDSVRLKNYVLAVGKRQSPPSLDRPCRHQFGWPAGGCAPD